jgi:hypothetical protein
MSPNMFDDVIENDCEVRFLYKNKELKPPILMQIVLHISFLEDGYDFRYHRVELPMPLFVFENYSDFWRALN